MFDIYKHMNDKDGVRVDIETIAEQVETLNYGFQRMLCALVRVRLKRRPGDALALAVKDLIDKGYT